MSFSNAFEITSEDVENVLRSNSDRISDSQGKPFDVLAEEIFAELDEDDFARIEKVALDSGVDLEDQTEGAYEELRAILVEQGILKN